MEQMWLKLTAKSEGVTDDEASDEECNDVMDQKGDQYVADDMEQEAVCTGTITGVS